MTEEMWLLSTRPIDMLGFLRAGRGRALLRGTISKEGVLRKKRLFLVACCARIQDLITDERIRHAIGVVERQADQLASPLEITQAQSDAASVYKALRSRSVASEYTAACAVMEMTRLTEHQASSHCIYVADLAVLAILAKCREQRTPLNSTACQDEIVRSTEEQSQARYLRDQFGNPFRLRVLEIKNTPVVTSLACQMYESRDFSAIEFLADAFQDAGVDNTEILEHCSNNGTHVRGCWVIDLVLGKQ